MATMHYVVRNHKSHHAFLIAVPLVALALGAGIFGIATDTLPTLLRPNPAPPTTPAVVVNVPKAETVITTAPPPAVLPAHDYQIPSITNGLVPVLSRIPTSERVAFLTIDDGIVTNSSDAQLMQAANAKATFFLVYRFINTDYTFFGDLATRTGSDIENHSYDHYLLTYLTYDQQKLDICRNADIFSTWYDKRPVLFRPSGGAYNNTTLRAAADCGMKALIMWDGSINNGVIKYQNGMKMRPGDIILMHFRSTFAEDLNAFVSGAHSSGLQPDLLINWL